MSPFLLLSGNLGSRGVKINNSKAKIEDNILSKAMETTRK
jgi:hypothetical protein